MGQLNIQQAQLYLGLRQIIIPCKNNFFLIKRQVFNINQGSIIPLDVTREILLRLPAKSLVRFRCVSKLWLSLTTEPYFIKSFTTRTSSRPRLLLSFGKQATRLFFSLSQHEINPDVDKCLSHNDDLSSYHVAISPEITDAC